MAAPTVTLERADGAARITLNRPDSLNAWNEQFGLELREAVATVAADDAVRALMITGAGREAQREQGRTATSSRACSRSPRSARRASPAPEPAAQTGWQARKMPSGSYSERTERRRSSAGALNIVATSQVCSVNEL